MTALNIFEDKPACLHPCLSFLFHCLVPHRDFICSAEITVSGHSIILAVPLQLCTPRSVGLENECRHFRCGMPRPDQSTAVVLIPDTLLLLRHSKVTVAFRVTVGTVLAHGVYTANEVFFFKYMLLLSQIFPCLYLSMCMFHSGVEVNFYPLKYGFVKFNLYFWLVRSFLDTACVSSFSSFCHLEICWFWNILGPGCSY